MQNRRVTFILALLILMISTACAQEQAPAATEEAVIESATEEPVATEAATSTPFVVRTLPPTWTPSPQADAAVDSSGDNGAAASTQPAPEENTEPELIAPTALEVCATFGEDSTLNKRTFTPGSPVQIFWTPVEGAASYFITLIDQFGDTVQTDYSSQTTLVYPPELFKPNSLYGWEVYPIDPAGRQMCISRGAELLADNRPGG